jgi:hypothetical protein
MNVAELIEEAEEHVFEFLQWCISHVEAEFEFKDERIGAILGAQSHTAQRFADLIEGVGRRSWTGREIKYCIRRIEKKGLIARLRGSGGKFSLWLIGSERLTETPTKDLARLPYDAADAVEASLARQDPTSKSSTLLRHLKAVLKSIPDSKRISSVDLAAKLRMSSKGSLGILTYQTISKMLRELDHSCRPRPIRFGEKVAKGFFTDELKAIVDRFN